MWQQGWPPMEFNRSKKPTTENVDWANAAQQWLKNKEVYEQWQQQQWQMMSLQMSGTTANTNDTNGSTSSLPVQTGAPAPPPPPTHQQDDLSKNATVSASTASATWANPYDAWGQWAAYNAWTQQQAAATNTSTGVQPQQVVVPTPQENNDKPSRIPSLMDQPVAFYPPVEATQPPVAPTTPFNNGIAGLMTSKSLIDTKPEAVWPSEPTATLTSPPPIMSDLKSKKLPLWIRDGLATIEKEKQKRQKAPMLHENVFDTTNENENSNDSNVSGAVAEQRQQQPTSILKPSNDNGLVKKASIDPPPVTAAGVSAVATTPIPVAQIDNVKKTERTNLTDEEKEEVANGFVKVFTTRVLLEVTDAEMKAIANEIYKRAQAQAKPIKKTSALSMIASGMGSDSDTNDTDNQSDDEDVEALMKRGKQKEMEYERRFREENGLNEPVEEAVSVVKKPDDSGEKHRNRTRSRSRSTSRHRRSRTRSRSRDNNKKRSRRRSRSRSRHNYRSSRRDRSRSRSRGKKSRSHRRSYTPRSRSRSSSTSSTSRYGSSSKHRSSKKSKNKRKSRSRS